DRAIDARHLPAQGCRQLGEQLAHGYSAWVWPTTTTLKPSVVFSLPAATGTRNESTQCSFGLDSTSGASAGFLFGNNSMMPGCLRVFDFLLSSCSSFASIASGFLSNSAGTSRQKSLYGAVPMWSPSIG